MWWRVLGIVGVCVLVFAIGTVIYAGIGLGNLSSALALWGFVLSAFGVLSTVAGFWKRDQASSVQTIVAQEGDAFGVQNGSQSVNQAESDGHRKFRQKGQS